jgi:hypothetical protein
MASKNPNPKTKTSKPKAKKDQPAETKTDAQDTPNRAVQEAELFDAIRKDIAAGNLNNEKIIYYFEQFIAIVEGLNILAQDLSAKYDYIASQDGEKKNNEEKKEAIKPLNIANYWNDLWMKDTKKLTASIGIDDAMMKSFVKENDEVLKKKKNDADRNLAMRRFVYTKIKSLTDQKHWDLFKNMHDDYKKTESRRVKIDNEAKPDKLESDSDSESSTSATKKSSKTSKAKAAEKKAPEPDTEVEESDELDDSD